MRDPAVIRIHIENSNGDDVQLSAWIDSDCGLLRGRIGRLFGIPPLEINFEFKARWSIKVGMGVVFDIGLNIQGELSKHASTPHIDHRPGACARVA